MSKHLERCWYASPPWAGRTPPLYFGIKERVFIPYFESIGWVCGAVWANEWEAPYLNWLYKVATPIGVVGFKEEDIRKCNRLQVVNLPPRKAELGEIVRVDRLGDRVVVGIVWNSREWQYAVERRVPDFRTTPSNHLVWPTAKEIQVLETQS